MTFCKADNITLTIPRSALMTVFDECDRHDTKETGGRILGTYDYKRDVLAINVNGIIEPGPKAHRTASYLKQDGAYQERVFREVEEHEPSVEHLGNWHTHHVNRMRHLSDGDIETYRRTVEHHKHNTEFFYALLVIEKRRNMTGLQRYIFNNYVLRRGDPKVYEIPSSALALTDAPLVWPTASNVPGHERSTAHGDSVAVRQNRVYDRDIVLQFYQHLKAFKSTALGLYWRGHIVLIDASKLEIVVIEDRAAAVPRFSVVFANPSELLARSTKTIAEERFTSCREALIVAERMCNAELYAQQKNNTKG